MGKKGENCDKFEELFVFSNIKQLQLLEFSVHVLFKLGPLYGDSCERIKVHVSLVYTISDLVSVCYIHRIWLVISQGVRGHIGEVYSSRAPSYSDTWFFSIVRVVLSLTLFLCFVMLVD